MCACGYACVRVRVRACESEGVRACARVRWRVSTCIFAHVRVCVRVFVIE